MKQTVCNLCGRTIPQTAKFFMSNGSFRLKLAEDAHMEVLILCTPDAAYSNLRYDLDFCRDCLAGLVDGEKVFKEKKQ